MPQLRTSRTVLLELHSNSFAGFSQSEVDIAEALQEADVEDRIVGEGGNFTCFLLRLPRKCLELKKPARRQKCRKRPSRA